MIGAKKQRVSGQSHGHMQMGSSLSRSPGKGHDPEPPLVRRCLVGGRQHRGRRVRIEKNSGGPQDDVQGAGWKGLLRVWTFTPCALPSV